jgi:alpha-tubulin suppressor-like RCC1 family protein
MWGSNEYGMKGDGTFGSNNIVTFATQVPNLTGIMSIAVGLHFCLALRSDGTVWAWGNNQYGQTGNGTPGTPVSRPTMITALSDVVTVSAGRSHAFAVKRDGTVWAWGQNQVGQVGNGTSSATPVSTPAPLAALTDIVHVQGGNGHSLALRSDGTILAWGNNGSGEIGNGTSDRVPVPVPVFNLTDVTALGTSWFHTLALRGDGTVYAWGENSKGALGNGSASATVYPIPAAVTGLTGATAVAAGLDHSLAVVGGTVRGWGSNSSGQLGTGTSSPTPVTGPVQALVLTDVTAVAAGGSHSLALKSDKTVWAWGSNSGGQLGIGGLGTSTPTPVPGLTNVMAIAAGNNLSMALRDDGTVWAWGANTFGEIGIGAASNTVGSPTQVLNLTNITAISGGWEFALALRSDGTVWGWGSNGKGQAGVPPAGTLVPAPVQLPGFAGVTAIDTGGAHSLALKSDGTVWAWGWNNNGQLGTGVDEISVVPLQVSMPPGVTGISAGAVHSLAVLPNKTLMAWGFNGQSQLARPFVTIVPTPVVINP